MVNCNWIRNWAWQAPGFAAVGCIVFLTLSGCASPWFRKKNQEELNDERRDSLRKIWESPDRPRLLGDFSRKVVTGIRVENVALVTELAGTGGKAEASSQRERLLDYMRHKEVPNPNQWLDDPSTAMVVAQVIVPPASRKGERLNTLVKISAHAEGTNLAGGWLMRSELKQMNVLGGQIKDGFGYAMTEGPLVTEQQISGSQDPEAAKAAMVVGGALLMESRDIGIAIEEEFAHPMTMKTVLDSINKRFTAFDGTKEGGVAKPKQQNYVELKVPPKYRKDPDHFANVVLNLGVAETDSMRKARLEECRMRIGEPTTARRAAWQLEAFGKEAIPALCEGLTHPDQEIRFYVAHALGYLNDARAIPILHELAASQPAFRAMSFNALSLIDNYQAADALESLLHLGDAETRYGAVLALRDHDSSAAIVQGEEIAKVGRIVEIPSNAAPLVVVGLHKTPEIVIFGPNPNVSIKGFLYVNPRMLIRSLPGGRASISHIVPGKDDRLVECASTLRGLLTGLSEVGAGYGDWVHFVRVCGVEQLIPAEVAINPVPSGGRKYDRDTKGREPGDHVLEDIAKDVAAPSEDLVSPDDSKKPTGWLNPLTWFEK